MKKILLSLFCFVGFVPGSVLAQEPVTEVDSTQVVVVADSLLCESVSDSVQVEDDCDEPVQKGKKKAKKPKKEPISFEEFMSTWEPPRSCGDGDMDAFFLLANNMLYSYKDINDSINFIRIETFEVPDEGDGITTAVKITDGNGNQRTKEAITKKWVAISLNFVEFAASTAGAINQGVTIVNKISSNPANAISLLFAIKQIKRTTQALTLLSREIPRTAQLIKEQTTLLKSAKSN